MVDTVNSSLTVTFVTASNVEQGHSIIVELDSDKIQEVYKTNKSQFLFGELAYFRVFTNPYNLAYEIITSDGQISDEGEGIYTTEDYEIATFANVNSANARLPISEIVETKWLGKSLGGLTIENNMSLVSESTGIAVLAYKYKSKFKRKALVVANKNVSEYPVLVYIREV